MKSKSKKSQKKIAEKEKLFKSWRLDKIDLTLPGITPGIFGPRLTKR